MSGDSRFALIANPGSRRALGFTAACRARGLPEPVVIPWTGWLSGGGYLQAVGGIGALRIETPAEDPAVERLLLAEGASACREERLYPLLPEEDCMALPPDEGGLRYQRQWYLGWRNALSRLSDACRQAGLQTMNSPAEIAVLFDKDSTRKVLQERAVPVPPDAGLCADFDELEAKMDLTGWDRVFLKPCHGSSASGVMAISRNRHGAWKAVTSAIAAEQDGSPQIRNSKRLKHLDDLSVIRKTVDQVCRERAIIERWFPKATLAGRAFDLRVLVIRGQACHVAVRTSSTPITNLHLRNRRGNTDEVRVSLGEKRWGEAIMVAEAAAAAFPGCHYCGVDLMIGAGGRGSAIAEVNAFGDLLHHELWHGMDPWQAEVSLW